MVSLRVVVVVWVLAQWLAVARSMVESVEEVREKGIVSMGVGVTAYLSCRRHAMLRAIMLAGRWLQCTLWLQVKESAPAICGSRGIPYPGAIERL